MKKTYVKPLLTEYGTLRELTLVRGPNGQKDCGAGTPFNCGNAGGNNGTSL